MENLKTFLRLADELKLKGVTRPAESKSSEIAKPEDLTEPVEIKSTLVVSKVTDY